MAFWNKNKKTAKVTKTWHTPGGSVQRLNELALEGGAHTMIAGNTRSGKSTLLHGIMADALKCYAPSQAGFFLIDPKGVELDRYKDLPHTMGYTDTEAGAVEMLRQVRAIMEARFATLKGQRSIDTPKYQGKRIYVVIDEMVQPMVGEYKAEFMRELMVILSKAGAANIWVIAGTQAPRRDIIPGKLLLYFTLTIGLSMASAVESRCALGVKGCEDLPLHGRALVKYGPELMTSAIPNTNLYEVQNLIDYWKSDAAYEVA